LAPGFLVASPTLADPNFDGTLVLMAEHHGEGALGFVVNRPGPITVADVLRGLDAGLLAAARATGRDGGQVMVGGPVAPERLWILHRAGAVPAEQDAVRVGSTLALGGSRELLEALARSRDAGPFLLFLGYAGWAPMQVEQEVAAGAWIPMPLAEDLVFEVPHEERWDRAVRRLGLEPGGFMVGGGGAQA
ncbi:MAG TPA: YqgE/AlgH family protein, partial [Anaeromyxobacteraceae bacterium]|nr:YqgE/AlgH family protein [Anaeromyxobacteraceae bacterium]